MAASLDANEVRFEPQRHTHVTWMHSKPSRFTPSCFELQERCIVVLDDNIQEQFLMPLDVRFVLGTCVWPFHSKQQMAAHFMIMLLNGDVLFA